MAPDYQEGVKHDTSTKICPQAQNDSGTEDCLYLDVYVPKKVWDARNGRRIIYRKFFSIVSCLPMPRFQCELWADSRLVATTAIWIHGGE